MLFDSVFLKFQFILIIVQFVYRNTVTFLYVDLIPCDLVEVITNFFVVVDT